MKNRPKENAMKRISLLIAAAVFAWFGLSGAPNTFSGLFLPPGRRLCRRQLRQKGTMPFRA